MRAFAIQHKIFLGAALCAFAAAPAYAEDAITSGAVTVERPTLVSAGFEWRMTSDDNRNAQVALSYRKKGENAWHDAMALMRMNKDLVVGQGGARDDPNDPVRASVTYPTPNMFAGSVFNLEPDTDYEARLSLSDPDGVSGEKEKLATFHTRKEPMPAAGGKVYNVYPVDWKGPKAAPAFPSLMAAYYLATSNTDWENAYPPRVKPGDVILLHGGIYVNDRYHYATGQPGGGRSTLGSIVDGTFYLTAKGTADKPIVIKAAGDGEVIIDGDGAETLFNLLGADYNYFEGITFRNATVGFLLGLKNVTGETGFTLKHSRIENMARAIQDDWSGSKDFYIADNFFVGRHAPEKMMSWGGALWAQFPDYPEVIGGDRGSEYAVKIYGQGHVVAYNYFAAWHDGADIATYGVPDGTPNEDPERVPVSVDIYNNDFYNMGDNCVEADGGAHNIRVFRNRCMNAPGGAFSAQPVWGGPVYFVQNIVYNTPTFGACKYSPVSGIYTLANTFIGECQSGNISNATYRDNLILATGAKPFAGQQQGDFLADFGVTSFTNYSSSDYNGFRPDPKTETAFVWNSPAFGTAADFTGKLVNRSFKTLKAYQDATGQDKHSVLVDFSAFVNVTPPITSDPQRVYQPENFDFGLKRGSPAIDKGVALASITDGFTGKAPDLGALEFGKPVPHYGPRIPVVGVPAYGSTVRAYTGPPAAGAKPGVASSTGGGG